MPLRDGQRIIERADGEEAEPMRDEYGEIYRVDTRDEWINSAYDEDGNAVCCDRCGGEMRWDPKGRSWRCPECGREMERIEYFDYIGAEPPGSECLTNCAENYPFCRRSCEWFSERSR